MEIWNTNFEKQWYFRIFKLINQLTENPTCSKRVRIQKTQWLHWEYQDMKISWNFKTCYFYWQFRPKWENWLIAGGSWGQVSFTCHSSKLQWYMSILNGTRIIQWSLTVEIVVLNDLRISSLGFRKTIKFISII